VRGIVVLVCLIATVTVGCGGDKDEQPPSKADYIALADVICRNHESRTQDLESQTAKLGRLNTEAKAHRVAGLLRDESDNLTAEVQELATRQPPPADAGTVESILSLDRARAGLIERWAKAYDDLDTAEIRRLQRRIGLATAEAKSKASAYGFNVCERE
jgi:hypothetical protein